MYVYKLPKHSKVEVLPQEYRGVGDDYFNRAIGFARTPPAILSPQYPHEKDELNKIKVELDKFSPGELTRYNYIAGQLNPTSGLKQKIITEYGGEVVTNAWLKMYELISFIEPILQIRARSRDNNSYTSMHFAEAPGNFILALYHKLKTEYQHIDWNWHANSYRPREKNDDGYLGDTYGLMRKYNKQWKYGCEGNGDITSPANIRSWIADNIKYDLVTSDVKYSPQDMDFAEEENVNTPVQFGQVLCTLGVLARGGTAILKFLTLYEKQTIDIIALLCSVFTHIYITKPETSRPYNSEIYLVCMDYKNTRCPHMENLLHHLNYTRNVSNIRFLDGDIDPELLLHINRVNKYLYFRQSSHLQAQYALYKKYRKYNNDQLELLMLTTRTQFATAWIDKYKLKILTGSIISAKPEK